MAYAKPLAPLPRSQNKDHSMFTTRPEIKGTFGVAASTHWLASAAGMGILEKGGNAFDAAVAMGFALQVVEPHLNGPGGEVPIILQHQASGKVEVICGQGTAPAGATIEHYRGLGHDLVPGSGKITQLGARSGESYALCWSFIQPGGDVFSCRLTLA